MTAGRGIALLSLAHALVDFLCALALFGGLTRPAAPGLAGAGAASGIIPPEALPLLFILYNFCAFALQMPLGAALDAWTMAAGADRQRSADAPAAFFTAAGILLTAGAALFMLLPALTATAAGTAGITGSAAGIPGTAAAAAGTAGTSGPALTAAGHAIAAPVVLLGLGNALFHVGGGVLTIHDDDRRGYAGRGLGVFVAPGAVGLCLGTILGRRGILAAAAAPCVAALILTALILREYGGRGERPGSPVEPAGDADAPLFRRGTAAVTAACFAVVVLRSWVGLSLVFPWKTGAAVTVLSACLIAGGKAAGGFAAARFGARAASILSLLPAAACFARPDLAIPSMAALFLFNMTMPITLYTLKQNMPEMPGLAFGILTFALFLGYLPTALCPAPAAYTMPGGVLGSMISALILESVLRRGKEGRWDFRTRRKDGTQHP